MTPKVTGSAVTRGENLARNIPLSLHWRRTNAPVTIPPRGSVPMLEEPRNDEAATWRSSGTSTCQAPLRLQ
jgi:hypothetical protein